MTEYEASVVWRTRLCLCGKSVVDGETTAGKIMPVDAAPAAEGKYELYFRHNNVVPGIRLLAVAARFGKTQLRDRHNCRYSNPK